MEDFGALMFWCDFCIARRGDLLYSPRSRTGNGAGENENSARLAPLVIPLAAPDLIYLVNDAT